METAPQRNSPTAARLMLIVFAPCRRAMPSLSKLAERGECRLRIQLPGCKCPLGLVESLPRLESVSYLPADVLGQTWTRMCGLPRSALHRKTAPRLPAARSESDPAVNLEHGPAAETQLLRVRSHVLEKVSSGLD